MNAREMFESAENILQGGGRVLLEVTAVLVLSYLLIFVGSLLVAAILRRPSHDEHGEGSAHDIQTDASHLATEAATSDRRGPVTVLDRR